MNAAYTPVNRRRNYPVNPAYLVGTNLPVANTTVTTSITITPTDAMSPSSTTTASERFTSLLESWYQPTQLVVNVPNLTTPTPGYITVLQTLNNGADYDVFVGRRWIDSSVNGWYELPLVMASWDSTAVTNQALRLKVQTFVPTGAVVSADVNGVTALSLYLQQ